MIWSVLLELKREGGGEIDFFYTYNFYYHHIYFYLPSLDLTTEEKELPDEILPDIVDDKSSLISEIEELKLEVFQKDQRIKFRDNQINDLRKEIKNINQSFISLENEYNKSAGSFSDLENSLSENSSKNLNEINNLKDKIDELNNLIKTIKCKYLI